jgi:hypothetical protein
VDYLELSEDDDNHDHYGRLFAASPKLLAALKELVGALPMEQWENQCSR